MADQQATRGPGQLSSATRRAGIGASVTLQILFAGAVLVMLNYLGMRHYRRFDWTRSNVYTLSEQTKSVARSLTRDVDVYVVMSQADDLFDPTREMLDRYVAESRSKLHVRYVDPDLDPTEFQRVVEEYPVQGGVTDEGSVVIEKTIIVTAGDRRQFVSPDEDFVSYDDLGQGGMDFSSRPAFNQPRAEVALTSALYGVTEGRQRFVCFTSGHGEWETGPGATDRSLTGLRDFMEHYEIQFRDVSMTADRPDLSDCAAVVVAGPRRPFLPSEAQPLERYVSERGGDLILLLDPIVQEGRFVPTGLEALARRFGVEIHDNEVASGGPTAPFCGGGHPTSFIVRTGEGLPLCVERARSVSLVEGHSGDTFLETTAEGAFGEADPSQLSSPVRDERDPSGPLSIGIAVEQDNEEVRSARIEAERDERERELTEADRRGSQVIVLGDSDILARRLVENPLLGNSILAMRLFFSVAGSEVLVAVPPREVERDQLTLSDQQLSMSFIIFVLGLPALGVAAGLSMWWTRRR